MFIFNMEAGDLYRIVKIPTVDAKLYIRIIVYAFQMFFVM